MNEQNLDHIKKPHLTINESLAKYAGKNLFPKKLEKANKTLQKIGLPTLPNTETVTE